MATLRAPLAAVLFRLRLRGAIVFTLAAGLAGCSTPSLLDRPVPAEMRISDPSFRQAMGALVTPGFVAGNDIQTLSNGAEIFPAMLAAIRSARRSVTFETFVFYEGDIPRQFAGALIERARAGVPVKVIIDALGGAKSRPYHAAMREAGVDLAIYRPLIGPDFLRYNYRTHRKLLVVDGRVGFIGGVGIGDGWGGDASNPEEWRDLHYRVTGPAVAQIQGAFSDNWIKTQREILQGPAYFPPLPPTGNMLAKAFFSSPLQGRASVELMYHLTIASSRRSILITNAYFLPNDTLTDALCAAARRGVRVQIIMPGPHMDRKEVERSSRRQWPRLMEAGVDLYQYQPTMMHSKLLIADGQFVSVGSANFDPRSLRINDEANLVVLDAGFARTQTALFQRDLRQSKRVDPREIRGPWRIFAAPVEAAQLPVESQL